jgi:predicted nucleic acid-binding protein
MNLLDSSVWITYFEEGVSAAALEKYLQKPGGVLVPTLVLHEVYHQLLKKLDEKEALYFVAQMEEDGNVVLLDHKIALMAAEVRRRHRLGTADAVIYATALASDATLVTLDNDFRNLPQCVVVG